LFASEFAEHVVFKGGTSLSKVFGVLGRFSEDIDLSVAPEFLNLPGAGTSRTRANKWMENAEAGCSAAVRTQIGPALECVVETVLGKKEGGWFEFVTDPATNSPVLLFHYPTSQPPGFDYLKRSVKLEFGALTDQRPIGRYPIRPWLADEFVTGFTDWTCAVVALELERAFWEKATILHAEYHRPAEKPTPARFSRHYADTAALAGHDTVDGALRNHELRDRVVAWKGQFFGSSWAKYDLAKPGSFRLVPPEPRRAALRRDYETMRDMYLAEPASFDEVLAILSKLEQRINETPGG
jgi:hypothetical protein